MAWGKIFPALYSGRREVSREVYELLWGMVGVLGLSGLRWLLAENHDIRQPQCQEVPGKLIFSGFSATTT